MSIGFYNELSLNLGKNILHIWCSTKIFSKRHNPSSANPTKWSNTLKQFVDSLLTNCLSVSDHFVGLVLKGLRTGKR